MKGAEYATLDVPPHHDAFDQVAADRKGKTSLVMQARREELKKKESLQQKQQQQQVLSPLQPSSVPNTSIYASHLDQISSAFLSALGNAIPAIHNKAQTNFNTHSSPIPTAEPLIPTTHTPGPNLVLAEFCAAYSLGSDLLGKLSACGFQRTLSFKFITVEKLEKAGFLEGEIAELKGAIEEWAILKN